MEYWKVIWHHTYEVEPVVLYSEIGPDKYEVRKVQVYRDGSALRADEQHEGSLIALGEIPVTSLEEVAADLEFSASYISVEEFDGHWEQARWEER